MFEDLLELTNLQGVFRMLKHKTLRKQKLKGGDNSNKVMLSAAEACAYLSIKPQTLYAYVSRGQLRAVLQPKGQGHLYARTELEALRARSRARAGHGPAAASAMRWGEPILDSAVSCVSNGMLFYRGFALSDLIREKSTFENVSECIWSGELPRQRVIWSDIFKNENRKHHIPRTKDRGAAISRRLFTCLCETAFEDANGSDELLDENLKRARKIVGKVVAELFEIRQPPTKNSSIAEAIATGLRLEEHAEAIDLINVALVSCADHELNASTFAARVAASTGADLYACILGGLSAFSGHRHGLSPLEAHDLVVASLASQQVLSVLEGEISRNRTIAGFGHTLYPDGDPRPLAILKLSRIVAERLNGEARKFMDAVDALQEGARTLGLPHANLDLGLVAAAAVLGLGDVGGSSIFLTGRIIGWTAHTVEQRQQGILLRPRARYIGRTPQRIAAQF